MEKQHYLAAVDGSDLSKKALQRVANMMREGDQLTIIHLIEPVSPYVYEAYVPQLVETVRDLGEELLAEVKEYCEKELSLSCETVMFQGEPAGKIIRYADEHDVDVIVMGSRGLGGLKEWFLGSVSHGVCSRSEVRCVDL